MNLYTHYILAKQLEVLLQPADPLEYAWGSVAPDIRYVAGMPRKQTHLEIQEIKNWLERYPTRRSFIQGYIVHCLLDRIDVAMALETAFPYFLLRPLSRKKLSSQQAVMLVEFYYLLGKHPKGAISGGHNEILEGLGIRPEQTQVYVEAISEYLQQPSFEVGLAMGRRLGLLDDTRVQKYLNAALSIRKNSLAMLPMLWSAGNAHFERAGAQLVRDELGRGLKEK